MGNLDFGTDRFATSRTLDQIQYLRGIAAMMVVLHHAVQRRPGFYSPLEESHFGRPGVLIFFVISGFVMMYACRKERPATFAKRRIIRVVPIYWVMTLVFFLLLFRNDVAAGEPTRRLFELLQSLLFIPHYHSAIETEIWPILVPGWTLNYEMFFFLVFFIGILAGKPGPVAIAILLALVGLGLVVDSTDALFVTWTNPFLLLFVAGILLAMLWRRTDFSRFVLLLPLGLGIAVIAAVNGLPESWIQPAFFAAGILTVAGTLALQDLRPSLVIPGLGAIGDASYSIYLSHTILMIPLYKAFAKLPLSGWPQFLITLTLTLLLCALAGIAIHRRVEKPMIHWLRQRFDRPAGPSSTDTPEPRMTT
ncbi:acyltransferase [Salipiger bermudensis]|uniref:acyltransferase family protein n=1 Tax=Salipiger bermudensis TaxID=344736 RepID=UPI001C9A215A|nr:acyltransferase [Salipiger bermudensis]MBY6005204.1 acyltransferase [Salipiger bermudensis]